MRLVEFDLFLSVGKTDFELVFRTEIFTGVVADLQMDKIDYNFKVMTDIVTSML